MDPHPLLSPRHPRAVASGCSSSCSRVRRYCAAAPGDGADSEAGADKNPEDPAGGKGDRGGSSSDGSDAGDTKGTAIADNTTPAGNNADHMVSAVAGNGQVVARAVTARNLLQVCAVVGNCL